MATKSWVIRLARTDRSDQPILIHVTKKSSGHILDLDLLATDGESAFRGKVRDRNVEKLRSTGYEGTPEEWSSILQHVFNPSALPTLSESIRDTLNVACSASGNTDKASLSVIIRQSVEGITHKFGTVELKYSENVDDVDLFGWAGEIAQTRDSLAKDLRASTSRYVEAAETIKSLQQQLENLIAAKKEHETHLLSKFAILLNEKKLRIRSQQHQLVQQPSTSKSSARKERPRKRKSRDTRDAVTGADSESEGFDNMDVDQDEVVNEPDSEDARMTSSGTDTASEPEVPSKPSATSANNKLTKEVAIPPARELPFTSNTEGAAKVSSGPVTTSKQGSEDEETASEEDEL